MNKQRRAALAKALPMLVEAAKLLAEAKTQIETVRDDEQEVLENLSDGQRDGELGSDMQQAVSDMTDTVDTLASMDIATLLRAISEVADAIEPEVGAPTLSEQELQERRMMRLAPWAKTMIIRAERDAASARKELAGAFSEQDPSDPRRIIVDDYSSAVKDRTIPGDQVAFPALGLRAMVTRDGKSLEINTVDMGRIVILPAVSNSVLIRVEKRFD